MSEAVNDAVPVADGAGMRRTMDARFFNAVANDAGVRPWIGGEGLIDLRPVIEDAGNYALRADTGGWVFIRHEAGTYELHTLFLGQPRIAGGARMDAWRQAARFMFTATDAREIVTRIPRHNTSARYAATAAGFVTRFERQGAFRTHTGAMADVSYRALTIDDWWPQDAGALAAGETFHAQIECAKARCGSRLPDHPPDEIHDRAAGAACLMIGAGRHAKGVWFYNRWARLAGYPPIALLSEAPVTIDVGAGVVAQVMKGEMEVIRCP